MAACASIALALCNACVLFDVGPFPGDPLPTVDGPEEPAVLEGTSGTLVVFEREDASHLRVLSLPALQERTIGVVGEAKCVSGPDDNGRVVYVQTKHGAGRWTYALRCVSLVDGADKLLLERNGELNVACEVALAPTGGLTAFTSSIDRAGYDYSPWVLEIVDVATGATQLVDGSITQHRPCWFPDGRQLAFVEWRSADRTRITSVLDVRTSDRRVVRESSDDELLSAASLYGGELLFASKRGLCRIDAQSGRTSGEDIHLPGNMWMLGELDGGKFLYEGLPTTGVEQRVRHAYIWPNDIKLADAQSGKFVTVVPRVWGAASYGRFRMPDSASAVHHSRSQRDVQPSSTRSAADERDALAASRHVQPSGVVLH
jgi:hypothetical protein